MPLNHLRTRRLPENPGSEVGIPYVDVTIPLFQAAAITTTAVPCLLPPAAGAGDVPPALVLAAAGVQGDVVISTACLDAGGLDAGLGFAGARVTTAGGPGVGVITLFIVNPTVAAIPVGAAPRTFRFYLDR